MHNGSNKWTAQAYPESQEAFSEEVTFKLRPRMTELPGQVGAEGHSLQRNGMSRDMDSGRAWHFGGVQEKARGQKHENRARQGSLQR